MGYSCEIAKRNNDVSVLVGWDSEVFEKIDSQEVKYKDFATRYARKYPNFLLDQSLISLIVLLRHKESGQDILVVTTHLWSNPRYDCVKQSQMYSLLY